MSSVMNITNPSSAGSKKSARAVTPIDLVQTLRPPGHFKRPVTPSGESPHTLTIQNMPFGGSLLGTTLYDRMRKDQEPALRSPQVYKNELFGRPFMAIGGNYDMIHSQHVLRVKHSAAAPGPNSYQARKMPPIKGGSFDRATHKSEIEDMIDRAAATPGPGEISRAQLKPPSELELHPIAEVITASVPPSECSPFLPKSPLSRAPFASAPTIGLAISALVCVLIWCRHLERDVQLLKSDCSKIVFTLICSNCGRRRQTVTIIHDISNRQNDHTELKLESEQENDV